ncbi:symmetrical bis(5'-nucleosyl)-tetraphosphatase [Kaarinaea lacus]
MAVYAIGDVQGCFDELNELLSLIKFNPDVDKLWFTGDLVNRGPKSLEVLRFVKSLGDAAITVLGNHDLHLLAVANKQSKKRKDDTIDAVLADKDCKPLLEWLRHQPLLHKDDSLGFTLIHGGLPPQWSLADAQTFAAEVESKLRGDSYVKFFANMYGSKPTRWRKSLSGWDRLRFITNSLTRLRYVDRDGNLALSAKGPLGSQPKTFIPWFQHPDRKTKNDRLVFGHWSTLGFYASANVLGLDSGCLWGGKLTAMRLDKDMLYASPVQLPCKGASKPKIKIKSTG